MKYKNSYATLDARLYNKQTPTPLENPKAGHFNPIVAKILGWSDDDKLMDNWVEILSGHFVPEGFDPLAMAYAGHQFGHWAGQLGDGRGLLMAQVIDESGELKDLHLKGMGLTPYSRMGDGRAVLRSTIREYLCGHAMSSLGIRSSNALGFVTSDTPVRRETVEQGAALMRVSDTHIRLGHIEWIVQFAPDLLPSFTEYMIETYYPELATSQTPVLDFISQVVERTAVMIADWQLIGFAHGVMNTDNLSITGTTIDYGPFGFLERFDPAWINNHSDHTGRYSYQNQPAIGHWNLNVWATHFMQLSDQTVFGHKQTITRSDIDQCLAHYEPSFIRHYQLGICKKIGLTWELHYNNDKPNSNLSSDKHDIEKDKVKNVASEKISIERINTSLALAFELLEIIESNKLDYTNSFRALIAVISSDINTNIDTHIDTDINTDTDSPYPHEATMLAIINKELANSPADNEHKSPLARWQQWQERYKAHAKSLTNNLDGLNHIDNINSIAKTAKPHGSNFEGSNIGGLNIVIDTLLEHNPAYVLRNSMAQRAIEQATSGNFSEVSRLFDLLADPYTVQDIAKPSDTVPPDRDAKPLVLSCSS